MEQVPDESPSKEPFFKTPSSSMKVGHSFFCPTHRTEKKSQRRVHVTSNRNMGTNVPEGFFLLIHFVSAAWVNFIINKTVFTFQFKFIFCDIPALLECMNCRKET